MSVFNIKKEHFIFLCKNKIPLDCIFIIEMIKKGEDINNEYFLPFIQRLQRKGYLDVHNKITVYGEELYNSLKEDIKEEIAIPKRNILDKNKFDEWWENFPDSNYFTYNGVSFKGTQNKKIQKEQCRKMFNVLSTSLFTADDIINSTKYHISTAMELSIKKRENQLTFIPNSERYLREQYFKPYIERMNKKGDSSPEKDRTVEI